jgi:hypothetical protein
MPLDLSDDYKAVDLAEEVTIRKADLAAEAAATTTAERQRLARKNSIDVASAFRGELTYSEKEASGGAYVRGWAAFDIPKALTEDWEWKPGDTLTDENDTSFNIFSASQDTAWWRLLCFDPIIANSLSHFIDIYDLAMDKDAAGAETVASEDLQYADVAARVVFETGAPGVSGGRNGELEQVTIYLGQRIYFKSNSLIKWTDPTTKKAWFFENLRWSMPDRLDAHGSPSAEARP